MGVGSDPTSPGCGIDCVMELLIITVPPEEGTLYVVPETRTAGEPGVIVWVPAIKGIGVVVGVSMELFGSVCAGS